MSNSLYRTWHVQLTSGVSFPFFRTTRRDHTADVLMDMLPKRGIGGVQIPVIGEVPVSLQSNTETHRGRVFVSVAQSEVKDFWFDDDLAPAERLVLHDVIQANATEST